MEFRGCAPPFSLLGWYLHMKRTTLLVYSRINFFSYVPVHTMPEARECTTRTETREEFNVRSMPFVGVLFQDAKLSSRSNTVRSYGAHDYLPLKSNAELSSRQDDSDTRKDGLKGWKLLATELRTSCSCGFQSTTLLDYFLYKSTTRKGRPRFYHHHFGGGGKKSRSIRCNIQ